jgi:uncharacterized integral membrane protein
METEPPVSLMDIDEKYSEEVKSQPTKKTDVVIQYGLHIVLLLAVFIIVCIIYNAPNYWLTFFGGAALLLLGWLAIN